MNYALDLTLQLPMTAFPYHQLISGSHDDYWHTRFQLQSTDDVVRKELQEAFSKKALQNFTALPPNQISFYFLNVTNVVILNQIDTVRRKNLALAA